MAEIRVSECREIPAAAPVLYELIADYESGHPRILPKQYFGGLEVLRGGRGEGTTIRFTAKAFGRVQENTGEITEPQPGTELRETLASGMVTTYRLVPQGPNTTTVTITTAYSRRGLQGWIERMLVPPYLRRVFVAELEQLAVVAAAAATSELPDGSARLVVRSALLDCRATRS